MILRKYEVRDEGAVLELLRLLIPRYFAESELADFKERATVVNDIYTDSEGVSYNSINWKN